MRHFWWLLVPACAVLAAPAQARPRDDALSGAFRCAVIADSRQWLDCYYGAAQPVRAALGLSPALADQVKLAAAPPGGGQPRDEDARDEVMAGAASCNRIIGDRAWLDCYYGEAMAMRVKLGLAAPAQAAGPPPPQLAYAPAAPVRPPAPSGPPPMPRSGGLFDGILSGSKTFVRDMPMQSYELGPTGAFTVTLADGEIWTQVTEDEVHHRARWRTPNLRVTISSGPMRTFTLQVEDEAGIYKVKRIR